MYKINQIVFTKKNHVCGSNKWKVVRVGVDIKLECLGCKRVIMISSYDLDKKIKPILSKKELTFLKEYNEEHDREIADINGDVK